MNDTSLRSTAIRGVQAPATEPLRQYPIDQDEAASRAARGEECRHMATGETRTTEEIIKGWPEESREATQLVIDT